MIVSSFIDFLIMICGLFMVCLSIYMKIKLSVPHFIIGKESVHMPGKYVRMFSQRIWLVTLVTGVVWIVSGVLGLIKADFLYPLFDLITLFSIVIYNMLFLIAKQKCE